MCTSSTKSRDEKNGGDCMLHSYLVASASYFLHKRYVVKKCEGAMKKGDECQELKSESARILMRPWTACMAT